MKTLLVICAISATVCAWPSGIYTLSEFSDSFGHQNQYYNPTHEPHTGVNWPLDLATNNGIHSLAISVGQMAYFFLKANLTNGPQTTQAPPTTTPGFQHVQVRVLSLSSNTTLYGPTLSVRADHTVDVVGVYEGKIIVCGNYVCWQLHVDATGMWSGN